MTVNIISLYNEIYLTKTCASYKIRNVLVCECYSGNNIDVEVLYKRDPKGITFRSQRRKKGRKEK